ncbi:MAG TPA: LLM class F420-dependent oxidoreductase [Acidimicrobiales bacterium]|nr:LLM class F420-dependent oxidoreductase [Acidimicrobiales bacterium]
MGRGRPAPGHRQPVGHRPGLTAPYDQAPMARSGMTIPFDGISLSDQRPWIEELEDLGYTDVWSSEAQGADAFIPLALAAAWAPSLRLGTAIVPAFTRGPALMAQSVATMAEAAPGRFAFGIGTSSNVIVENWNGIPFEDPYKRTRDMVRFLRAALTGEKVDAVYETFTVKGFRLGRRPPEVPPILVAALRPGMLRLAGREGDGAIINWLSAEDVRQVVPEVGAGKEIVARIFCCPSPDAETVRGYARMAIAAYLNVPVYAAFHQWLGREPVLKAMWDAWKARDRKAATAAIPDSVVDELIVHGPPEACREHIARYVENGVTTTALAILPFGIDARQAARDLSPAAAS